MEKLYTVNLEQGMPTVRDALHHLDLSLSGAKPHGITILKLIHGYGSTGSGGKIKIEIIKALRGKKNKKQIVEFIPGEEFSPFDPRVQQLIGKYPEMLKDKDYARMNYGITMVFL
jgi:Smr domain.